MVQTVRQKLNRDRDATHTRYDAKRHIYVYPTYGAGSQPQEHMDELKYLTYMDNLIMQKCGQSPP